MLSIKKKKSQKKIIIIIFSLLQYNELIKNNLGTRKMIRRFEFVKLWLRFGVGPVGYR